MLRICKIIKSDKPNNYEIMKIKLSRKTAWNIARLVVGHGAWIGLSLHWGIMGLMIGGIIALITAPKGFYVE